MANLHFHYGTMGSSKSAQLLINAYNQNKNGNKTEILKPKTDNRFSIDHVDSRIRDRIGKFKSILARA